MISAQLSWLYLSDAQWVRAADSFERMTTLNNWSHSTYLAIASGVSGLKDKSVC